MNVDKIRKIHLSVAEWMDAWRVIPRAIVGCYMYLLYRTITWYMSLHPYMLDGCKSDVIKDCIVQAPSTQHAALITAVVSMGAAIFGFYTNTGRKWDNKFIEWDKNKITDSTSE